MRACSQTIFPGEIMQYLRFTIVALAITAASSSASFAEGSPAAAQCVALINQEKIAEAEAFCVKAAAEPGKDGKLLYADYLGRKGDFDGAASRYSEILDGVDLAKPTQTEYSALRNRAFLKFFRQESSADDDVRAVLKLMPEDPELLEVAAQSSSSPDRRLEYADRLVALNPKSVQAQVLRSYALVGLKKGEEALTAAETAAKLDPDSPLPLIARGFAHSIMGDHTKAEREFAAAARKAPNEPEPKVSQAEMLVALKRFDDAIQVATEALALRPNHSGALRLRASARLSMGDAEGALADIDAANKIQFVFGNARESAEKVMKAQKAMQPASIAAMERDRLIVLAGMEAHLRSHCGNYSVSTSDDADNTGLTTYRDCIRDWYKTDYAEIRETIGRDVLEAGSRFAATAELVDDAERLQCSKMPRKSRCVPDSLYARALASYDLSDPRSLVGQAEFARLNQEVAVYNASVKRQNALIKTANFLDAVANALSSQ
jgi:tetratricopeptide (TPR) repeat protein